jgi:hypothetical protein
MSGRHKVQDATGVVVSDVDGNALVRALASAPSDSEVGFQTGALHLDTSNKRHHINVGTTSSSAWARSSPVREIINVTSADAKTLVLSDSGALVVIDFAGAVNIELPEANATNIGWSCEFLFKQAATGNVTIDSSRTADLWYGSIHTRVSAASTGKTFIPAVGSSDDRMVITSDNLGRLAGGFFKLEIAAANMIVISGTLVGTAAVTTPFT